MTCKLFYTNLLNETIPHVKSSTDCHPRNLRDTTRCWSVGYKQLPVSNLKAPIQNQTAGIVLLFIILWNCPSSCHPNHLSLTLPISVFLSYRRQFLNLFFHVEFWCPNMVTPSKILSSHWDPMSTLKEHCKKFEELIISHRCRTSQSCEWWYVWLDT